MYANINSQRFPNEFLNCFDLCRTNRLSGTLATERTRRTFTATAAAPDHGRSKCCNAVNVSSGFMSVVSAVGRASYCMATCISCSAAR